MGESDRCLWHNPAVRKSDPYVHDLLAQADALAQADLAEFHLAGLVWPGAALPLRSLHGADLREVFLDGADLSGSDLSQAVLRRASLKRADLRGAKLVGADLTGTNLAGADLREADLSSATLDDTALNGCDLRGANLTDARITHFRWNSLTRFAGVKGLDDRGAGRESDEGDPTQAFPAPLAMGRDQLSDSEVSALAESDPAAHKTRVYAPVIVGLTTPAQARPATPLPQPAVASTARNPWRLVAAASLVLAAGGAGFGVWGLRHTTAAGGTPAVPGLEAILAQERANLERQREADLAEIRRVQNQGREATERLNSAQQTAAVHRAEAETARASLHEAESDRLRLLTADDRATLLALKVDELTRVNAELARHSARQDQVGHILADGVTRLQQDNHAIAAERDQRAVDQQRLAQAEEDTARLRGELSALKLDRDGVQSQNQKLSGELLAASRELERYLARVNAAQLQDYLTGDDEHAPLLPVRAGQPIALSGDYLLTLRVDPGTQPGTVQAQVVVQRPAGSVNPDVTLVLYDQDRRPLRRLAYGFPHVDDGRPFVATTTVTACDRFPAFARVLVSPGLDGLSAQH